MAKFDPERYVQFRLSYPPKIFEFLKTILPESLQVIDLGAGTGFSAQSFVQVFPQASVVLVEPDPAMLEESKALFSNEKKQFSFVQSSAEKFIAQSPVDLVLIGSAWHWMDRKQVLDRMRSYLNPQGVVHIFEYQFPKCADSPELNEWVRRQFNLTWKAPDQVPRGKLKELVLPLLENSEFKLLNKIDFNHEVKLGHEQLMGEISSQSRFIHFENSLPNLKKENYRLEIRKQLNQWFAEEKTRPFFYRMKAYSFKRSATNSGENT